MILRTILNSSITILLISFNLNFHVKAKNNTQSKGNKNSKEFFVGIREGSDVSFYDFFDKPKKSGIIEIKTPYDAVLKGRVSGVNFEAVFTVNVQGNSLSLSPNGLGCDEATSINTKNPGPITIEFKEFKTGRDFIQYTGFRTITFKSINAAAKAKVSNDPEEHKAPKLGEATVSVNTQFSRKPLSITRIAKALAVTQFSVKFLKRNKPRATDPDGERISDSKTSSQKSKSVDVKVRLSGSTIYWVTEDESNIKNYEIVKSGTSQVLEVVEPLGADEYSLDFDDKVELIINKLKGKKIRITPTKK